MAIDIASQIQKWNRKFHLEYVRKSGFLPYIGTAGGRNAMMPIISHYELEDGGRTINVPYLPFDDDPGVQGRTRLTGNEGALTSVNFPVMVNYNRNGKVIERPDETWTALNLRDAAKAYLLQWAAVSLRDDIISRMWAYDAEAVVGRVPAASEGGRGGPKPLGQYLALSEAKKDAWLAANADRFLFGGAVSNHADNDHSAALAALDDVNDRMTTGVVSLARSLARQAEDVVSPMMPDDATTERYILFVGPRAFTDVKRDPAMQQANRDARIRGENNPIFQDGDLLWDGVIIREIPEIQAIPGVGAGGVDVEPAFLCGAQAVVVAVGERPVSTVDNVQDHNFRRPVGIRECRGVAKFAPGGKQRGMVNLYVAAPRAA